VLAWTRPPLPLPPRPGTHTHAHTRTHRVARAPTQHARPHTRCTAFCFNTVRSTSPCFSSVRARNVATRWRCNAHRTTYNSHYSRSGPLAFVLNPFEALRCGVRSQIDLAAAAQSLGAATTAPRPLPPSPVQASLSSARLGSALLGSATPECPRVSLLLKLPMSWLP
jgi:hypothetical protein